MIGSARSMIAGAVQLVANPYCPTWSSPTREDWKRWILWGSYLGRPRPRQQRVMYRMATGEVVMSPENYRRFVAGIGARADRPGDHAP